MARIDGILIGVAVFPAEHWEGKGERTEPAHSHWKGRGGGPGRRGSKGKDGPGGTQHVAREDTLATSSETALGTRRKKRRWATPAARIPDIYKGARPMGGHLPSSDAY
ncbi:hypothetical protein ACOMHN_028976 [Nucella lapillus]